MTSDTKIGLLLGLVFIFVIAFLINGLPSFRKNFHGGNDLTLSMMEPQAAGLAVGERRVNEGLTPEPYVRHQEFDRNPIFDDMQFEAPSQESGTRSIMDLSKMGGGKKKGSKKGQDLRDGIHGALEKVASYQPKQPTKKKPSGIPTKGMPYTVKDSDTLSKIAITVYGKKEGNRWVNVQRIYNANRDRLDSIDSVKPGQRIWIPSLEDDTKSPVDAAFVKVGGNKSNKTTPPKQTKKPVAKAKSYRVKAGDTLSEIAAKQLGSSKRYLEIFKMNKDRMSDEHDLKVDMLLRLPKS